jgi:protein-L-isoaspartate O-methyltransferase
VLPVGSRYEQDLLRVVRKGEKHTVQSLGPCRFVPLIGRDAWDARLEFAGDGWEL